MIGNKLRQLFEKVNTEVENNEAKLSEESVKWREEYFSGERKIPESELATIIDTIAKVGISRFEDLSDNETNSGMGVRVDLSRGFTEDAKICLERFTHLQPLVLFPVSASGDITYCSEGRLIIDSKLCGYLREITHQFKGRVGLLADPAEVISQVLTSPASVYQFVYEKLSEEGVALAGLGCSFHKTSHALYNLLWVSQVVGSSQYRFSPALFEAFADPHWNEPVSPMKNGLPDYCMTPKDGISSVWGNEEEVRPYFSKSFATYLSTRPSVKRELTFDTIIYSAASGWVINHRDGSEAQIAIEEIIELARLPKKRVGLVIDPSDIAWEKELAKDSPLASDKEVDRLRKLPYPYHYYLAPSSDVDWSRLDHLEKTAEVLNDQCGLNVSGSAYLSSMENSSVSWSRMLNDRSVEDAMTASIEDGLIDTFHGIARSYETVNFDFLRIDGLKHVFTPDSALNVLDFEGVILLSSKKYEVSPQFAIIDGNGNIFSYQSPKTVTNEKRSIFYYTYSNNDFRNQAGDKANIASIQATRCTDIMDGFVSLQTSFSTADYVRSILFALEARNISMPVFTMHGGGKETKRFGMYATEKWVERNSADDAIDSPDTPYYLLPDLKKCGTFFFNPVGFFAPDVLVDVSDMLRINNNQDGSQSYIFRRLASRRCERDGAGGVWSYGKRTASSQGLAYNLRDLIQRFHHAPYGQGCILYTHFGHRVGNQASNRLGWNEELLAAWQWLSEHVHAQDCEQPVPFRVWVAPASAVLAYSTVMAGLSDHVTFDGDTIRITSWKDKVLGMSLPGPIESAGSWLHGITVYIDNPENAEVLLDGLRYGSFTRNEEDHTGRKSITLVDNLNLIPVALSNPTFRNECIVIREFTQGLELAFYQNCEQFIDLKSISLRNVTHWAFEFLCPSKGIDWEVSLITDKGVEIRCNSKLMPAGGKVDSNGFIKATHALDPSRIIPEKLVGNFFGRYVMLLKVSIASSKGDRESPLLTIRNLSLIRPVAARKP